MEKSQQVEDRTSLLNLLGHTGGNGSDACSAIIGLQPRADWLVGRKISGRMW